MINFPLKAFSMCVLILQSKSCRLWYSIRSNVITRCFQSVMVLCRSMMNNWLYKCFYLFCCFDQFGIFRYESKSLMKFSLSSCHMNVSPRASSILYHLFGKSSSVDGNKCGHVRSSLYPSLLHSFSHVLYGLLYSVLE